MIVPTAPKLASSRDSEEVRKSLLDMARQMDGSAGRFGRYPESYSEFDSEGNLRMFGNATVYDDLNMPFATGRVAAANAPTWATVSGVHGAYRFAVDDYIQVGAREFEHDYKEGSDIELHVHWMPHTTATVDQAVRWQVSYMIANMGEVFSSPITIEAEAVIPAGTAALTHIYTGIGIIRCPTIKIGAYISTVIRRITATGTAPAQNPFGIALGIHYEIDSLGSRTTTGK